MKPVTPSLDTAIGALNIVADGGAELDTDQFAELAAGMQSVRDQLSAVNERVVLSGKPPTPNDFFTVMQLLAFTEGEQSPPRAAPGRYVVASRNKQMHQQSHLIEDIHVSDDAHEVSIQWLVSTGAPVISVHGDSWEVFLNWPALFQSLAKLRFDEDRPFPRPRPGEVEAVLIAHGFVERKFD